MEGIGALCVICKALDPSWSCSAGHSLCAPCAAVVAATTEKILGVADMSTPCPLIKCTEFISSAAAGSPAGVSVGRAIARAASLFKGRGDAKPDPSASMGATPPRGTRLIRLAPTDADGPEYARVLAVFAASMPKDAAPRGIFRIENSALRAMYETCRQRMELRQVGAREQQVFHATTRIAAGAIVREGFNAHRAGQAHGTALGAGIYVANSAKFSHNYSSEDSVGARAMFICQVLLGASGTDSRTSGDQHVVFREQQILPTYLIHYDA